MSYYATVALSIEEALEQEISKGFDSADEFKEVMIDIAYEYNVTVSDVYAIYSNMDVAIA